VFIMNAELSEDHPFVLELTSLHNTAARFQHEAHIAAVKLQRHSLDTSHTLERIHILERENAHLTEEITLLRAHPDITPHPASLQVQELTLALRRVSDKLDLAEDALLTRTAELASVRSDLVKAAQDVEGAFELAARMRAREEESKVRERDLEIKARAAEEERKMADLVVQEYADLVRSIEGRPGSNSSLPSSLHALHTNGLAHSSSSNVTLVDSLHEGKSGLHKLLTEFNSETEKLEAVISQLQGKVSVLETKLESEQKTSKRDRFLLSHAQTELDKARMDDNTAAKMVSRYMKFSQSSTDALQKAMEALRARHAGTVNTLSAQINQLEHSLGVERRQAGRLRDALDELSFDIARETYGRRREISLRLALLAREESITEGLRRWSRRAQELFERSTSGQDGEITLRSSFERAVQDAEGLLDALDGGEFSLDGCSAGALARVVAARDAVSALTHELQAETERRMELEKQVGHLLLVAPPTSPPIAPELVPSLHSPISRSDSGARISSSATLINDPPSPSPQSATLPQDLSMNGIFAEPSNSNGTGLHFQETQAPVRDKSSVPEESPYSGSAHVTGSPDDLTNLRHSPVFGQNTQTLPMPSPSRPIPEKDCKDNIPELQMAEVNPPPNELLSPLTPRSQAVHILRPEDEPSQSIGDLSVVDIVEDAPSSASSLLYLPSQTGDEELSSELESSLDNISCLISSLAQVQVRYDTFQRAFRDCHLALKDLKRSLLPLTEHLTEPNTSSALERVIERLDDFNEDTRVELEIRIADEELVAHGFETLLAVPGAIADATERTQVEQNLTAFVDGTDPAVDRAMHRFSRKLDDLQHDIAAVKRVVHELPTVDSMLSPAAAAESPSKTSSNWSSWTAGLLGAGAPRPSSPAPTFGSVMTSPRLRHSPSFTRHQTSLHRSSGDSSDPLANLGLRIPMPSLAMSVPPSSSPVGLGIGYSPARAGSRPRTLSGMYMLGLGS
ncbi:hypothetical protein SERLA73DRAFT_19762, partial [Serpula lacrymans var. lacrymans S7.3]